MPLPSRVWASRLTSTIERLVPRRRFGALVADSITENLRRRLERRVLSPEGQGRRSFLFFEVGICGRRADAISLELWRSREQLIQGYEFKASRADWLNELRDPAKAAPAVAVCDRFWLITPPDIVRPGEVPEHWGHLVAEPTGYLRPFRVAKQAPPLTPLLDRTFFLTLMKLAWYDGSGRPQIALDRPKGLVPR